VTNAITEFGQYADMRRAADNRDPAVLREVASQFEALFVQTLLKDMREARLGDSLFGDNEQHEMYQEMLDKQLALEMSSGKGIGLADMLVRQLGGNDDPASEDLVNNKFDAGKPVEGIPLKLSQLPQVIANSVRATTGSAIDSHKAGDDEQQRSSPGWSTPAGFVRAIWPFADKAATALELSTEALVAQAALETGWGRHVMETEGGESTFNLFGIKASGNWQGERVARASLEFANGVAEKTVSRFRAYPNISATFDDYVNLIRGNARYSKVPGHGDDVAGFANALQQAGYATDPEYAQKIAAIQDGETWQEAMSTLKLQEKAPISAGITQSGPGNTQDTNDADFSR